MSFVYSFAITFYITSRNKRAVCRKDKENISICLSHAIVFEITILKSKVFGIKMDVTPNTMLCGF